MRIAAERSAPSRLGSLGLRNLEPGACSCWWLEQQRLRPRLRVSTVRRCSSGPFQKVLRIHHPPNKEAYRLSKETGDSAFRSRYHREGFRHEGGCLALLVCSIANYVFEHLQVVGRSQHRRVTKVDLTLTGGGDFVMVTLDIDSTLREGQ